MTDIHKKLSSKFRSQWIKIRFYDEDPGLKGVNRPKGVRFCEATKYALSQPVILDKNSVSCIGAKYAFGWKNTSRKTLFNRCSNKLNTKEFALSSMISRMPRFQKPLNFIGLNTEGEPDLVISYLAPSDMMNFVRVFNNEYGKNLECSLCSMMSICGGIAAATYLNKNINISFGCEDSRRLAEMKRDNLAIGISREMLKSLPLV